MCPVGLPDLLVGVDVVVVRILGGYRSWQDGIDAVLASGVPTVVVSGEQAPDADLMERSNLPAGIALPAHIYLAQGGIDESGQPARLPVRHGADDRRRISPSRPVIPTWGRLERPEAQATGTRRSQCCTTGPSSWPATPRTSRRCARQSKTPAAGRSRCTARRCTGAGAVNQRSPRPLTRMPNSTPLRAIAVTMLLGTPCAASSIALHAAIERLRKKWSLPAMKSIDRGDVAPRRAAS